MKRAAATLGLAIAGSQAGHLLAYELRFGVAAQQVQSAGTHAYYPFVAKTVLGASALAIITSLFLVGFARVATGRKIVGTTAPSLLRLLAGLYTLQLAFFIVQETVEGGRSGDLFLWGLLGQLPVALAGAVALRWLLARVGPALASILRQCELALEVSSAMAPLRPARAPMLLAPAPVSGPITRRGPPPSF